MILVAPDKFKGTLSGDEVASIVSTALRQALPDETVVELPLADGGEGTVALALRAGFEEVHVWATGPIGSSVHARYAQRGDTAVIEMASVAGIDVLPGRPNKLTALTASTYGVGELIDHALALNPRRIVLGVGGSATTDGGVGLACALGARITTETGADVPPGAAGLHEVSRIDFSGMIGRLSGVEVVIASDVDSPLLGSHGSAALFGPQKGADADSVALMAHGLAHWADMVERATGNDVRNLPGAGAAGGITVPLLATGVARIESGANVMMELAGFPELAADASVVVVGEGSLDVQSLRGKGPIGIAQRAKEHGAAVIAVVGVNRLTADDLESTPIDRVYAMNDIEPDLDTCLVCPNWVLERLAADVAAAEATGAG